VFRDANNNYFPGITNNSDWNFETEPPPSISGYSADPTCMGETITINGTGFGSSTPTVTVNGINVVPLGSTPITITIVVPTTTSGNATVVVTNTGNGLNDSDNTLTLKEAVAANLPLSTDPANPVVSQNYSVVVSNSQTTVEYRVRELPTAFAGGYTFGNGGDLSLGNFNKGTPGTYQYEVQTRSTGCTVRVYGPLDVVIASLQADAGANQQNCSNETVILGGSPTASGGTGFHSITWSSVPADPTLVGQTNLPNPVVSPSVTTTYTVTVDDSSPTTPATDQVTITVIEPADPDDLSIVLNPNETAYTIDDSPVNLSVVTLNGVVGSGVFSGPGVNSSTNKFFPNAANVGDNQILLTFTRDNGCITEKTRDVSVYNPSAYLATISPKYCIDEGSDNLTIQQPPNHTYQNSTVLIRNGVVVPIGSGWTVNHTTRQVNINTETLGTGNYTFEILYNYSTTCYSFEQVFSLSCFCYIIQITPYPCSRLITARVNFEITPLPTLELYTRLTSYCIDQENPVVVVSPPGGALSVNGGAAGLINTGGQFFLDLDNLALNTHIEPPNINTLSYTYTDGNSCSNSETFNVTVFEIPQLDFNNDPVCDGVAKNFSLLPESSIPTGVTIAKYEWNFGNGAVRGSTDVNETISFKYDQPDDYDVTVSATTTNGCFVTETKSLTVAPVPEVDFSWENVCETQGTNFLGSISLPPAEITQVNWDFGNGVLINKTPPFNASVNESNTTGTVINPIHQYQQVGKYNVSLEAVTNFGCSQNIQRSIYKVPSDTVYTGNEYVSDFNATSFDWVSEGINSSWTWGIPGASLINDDAPGGGNAWVTNLTGTYNTNEDSWVHSPCFDLTEIKRPYLQFDFRSLTRALADGAVLQYNYQNTTDDETDWIRVDAPNDTENWYNGSGIASNPGNQSVLQRGWTGLIDTTAWRTTVIALDDVVQSIPANRRDRVRFRFAFSSLAQQSTIQPQFEGFAFDNFEIGERDRVVLIEQFTNNGSTNNNPAEPNRASNTFINNFINSGNGEAVKLEYHVGFPGPNMDPLYLNNEQDMNARAAFYGVVGTPTTFVNANTGNLASIFQNETLRAAQVTIDTIYTTNTPADQLNVTVRFTANRPLPANTRLHIAAIETLIDTTAAHGTNGETSYQYVVRKLIPNALGTVFTQPIPRDSSRTVNVSWTPKAYRLNRLGIIAFVQNGNEIYQARMDTTLQYIPPANLITGIEDPAFAEKILIYPNPANREVNVVLPERTLTPIALNLMDAHGRTVHINDFATGEQQKTIDTSELASGLYILQFNTQQGVVRKKVMVVHEK
jgi:hypothetical protein